MTDPLFGLGANVAYLSGQQYVKMGFNLRGSEVWLLLSLYWYLYR
jgi:hypothetical protein